MNDPAAQLRTPSDLRALVESVVANELLHETEWIEWKREGDPSTRAGGALIGKFVAGFANRSPDSAAVWHGGVGYLVLGAEPGAAVGVKVVDPSGIDDQVSRYLNGRDAPWSPHYVEVAGAHVLVILVEPPRWGMDPVVMRQTFRADASSVAFDEGTIFVRRSGKTAPANYDDLKFLVERARRLDQGSTASAPSAEANVELRGGGGAVGYAVVRLRISGEPPRQPLLHVLVPGYGRDSLDVSPGRKDPEGFQEIVWKKQPQEGDQDWRSLEDRLGRRFPFPSPGEPAPGRAWVVMTYDRTADGVGSSVWAPFEVTAKDPWVLRGPVGRYRFVEEQP